MQPRDKQQNPLEYQILEEKAAALSRITAKMEAALEALRAFDREIEALPPHDRVRREARARLVDEAGELVWCFVVQREALGMRRHDGLFELYDIPAEVRGRMGVMRRR